MSEINPATTIAARTDQRTDVEPDPAVILPSPVINKLTGIIIIITAIGIIILKDLCLIPFFGLSDATSSDIIGTAPSAIVLPSFKRSCLCFFHCTKIFITESNKSCKKNRKNSIKI